MEITGEYLVPAPPQKVWEGLNNPEILRRAIPGCTAMDRTGENEYTATVVARVGPVSATFKGKVELADLDPPFAYTIRGRGQGGPAGFAKGEARISLAPEADATRLTYSASVDIGGKLASVGGRLIQGVARKNADEFFAAFAAALTGKGMPEAAAVPAPGQGGAAAGPAQAAAVRGGGHIPLIDRVAWLVAGIGIGVAATLLLGVS